jgi:hypothetical protein
LVKVSDQLDLEREVDDRSSLSCGPARHGALVV